MEKFVKYSALIPVKSLDQAKSRLAHHLTPEQRANLMLDMLHHVVCVLKESHVFSHVSVVSADIRVLVQAQTWGARVLPEEQAGHNPALTAAAQCEMQLYRGLDALLTISADLPFLQVNDILEVVAQAQKHPIVLAPSQEGTGTNAVLMRPPLAIPYVFGVNSLAHYRAEAERYNLGYALCSRLGLAMDIDTMNDVNILQQEQPYSFQKQLYSITPCR